MVGLEVAHHRVAVEHGHSPGDVQAGPAGHVAQRRPVAGAVARAVAGAVRDQRPVVAVAPRRLPAHVALPSTVVVRKVRGHGVALALDAVEATPLDLLVDGVVDAAVRAVQALKAAFAFPLALPLPLALPDLGVGVVPRAVRAPAGRAAAQ